MGDFKKIIAEVMILSEAQGERATLELLKTLNENKDYNDTQTLVILLIHKTLSYSLYQLKCNKDSKNIAYKYAITIFVYMLKKYDKKFEMKYLKTLIDRTPRAIYGYLSTIEKLDAKYPEDKVHLQYLEKIETEYLNHINKQ